MTDLPADPSAWDLNEEHTDTDARPGADASADGGDPTEGDDASSRLPVPVVYDTLDTYTPKVSWKALIGPLVAVALVSIGLGLIMARGGDDEKASSGSTAAPTTTVAGVAPTSTAAPSTTATSAGTTTSATATAATATVVTPVTTAAPAPTTTTAPAVPTTPPTTAAPEVQPAPPVTPPAVAPGDVDLADPVRYAEFTDGKVYLHGRVPSPDLAQRIIDKVAAVVGKDNVIVDYVVDPTAPAVAGGPLRVTDTVQFEPGSTVIRPEFEAILRLGIVLMTRNPSVQIIVVGRADPRGGAGYNFRLSQARAEAVVDYLVVNGEIDPNRLTVDPRGADDPLAEGDDLAANAANRSVEFIILGLID